MGRDGRPKRKVLLLVRMQQDQSEVIIEFYRMGHYIKVSAVDPVSLTEVSIVGSPQVGQTTLERTAIQKLRYVLDRKSGKR